ncbi:collagen-like protein [Aquimarina intermedia]|uniref:Collagen triple helix repeat protein n=1 Tax=Aquimarina intermedia TaxID=350814 RepID=A0A5S5C9S0_9FLAO|nr:collagen-like protein [Aquimarina intermedia]TYP76047.1 hypothetical protein BD809_102261 [Aquimarina intermedia]
MKKNYFKILLVCALSITLANCDGEDGANGLDGTNGINGENGANGENGVNGENGEGFDDLVKYGNITVSLEGNRPDGEAFIKEEDFRFTAVEGSDIQGFNSIVKNPSSFNFSVVRFLSAPDDVFQESWAEINLTVNNPGEATESLDLDFQLLNYAVITEDNKYFTMSDFFSETSTGVTNFTVSDYAFNEETNNLTLTYSLDVAAANNDTGNDLSISGTVDVIVLERISPPAP